MKRRDLFKMTSAVTALAGAGTTAAVAQPAAAADWRPQVFNGHQNDTIVALTDLMIPATDTPGAKAANVNRCIDLMLTVASTEERQQSFGALGWIDGHANEKHGHSFVNCSRDEQISILKDMDSGVAGAQGKQVFEMVKGVTTRFYYNTAIGFRELNKGGRVPATFGCEHNGHA